MVIIVYDLYKPLLRLHKKYVNLLLKNDYNYFNSRKLERIYFFNGGLAKMILKKLKMNMILK